MVYGIKLNEPEKREIDRYESEIWNKKNIFENVEDEYSGYKNRKKKFEMSRESSLYKFRSYDSEIEYKDEIDDECDMDIFYYD